MYVGDRWHRHADRPAIVMASSGETVSYAELERRSTRLAHLLRAEGLKRLDHYAIYMENNARYLECNGAGERAGLYFTCVNSWLQHEELAYVVDNCQAQVLVTSLAKLPVARAALASCPRVHRCLVVGGGAAVRELGVAHRLPARRHDDGRPVRVSVKAVADVHRPLARDRLRADEVD